MNQTIVLTGMLPAIVIVSTVLTALVSGLLLWVYRRSVVKAMNLSVGDAATHAPQAPVSPDAARKTMPALTITDLSVSPDAMPSGGATYRHAMQLMAKSAWVYALGGLAYALVMTTAQMIIAGGGFYPIRFLMIFTCYAWAMVLCLMFLLPAVRLRIVCAYLAALAVIPIVGLIRSADLTLMQIIQLWFVFNAAATLLLFAFLHQRVRAVGPLVLMFMVATVTGAFVMVSAFIENQELIRQISIVGSMLGLGATVIFILMHVIGFVLLAIPAWGLLRWLGYRYQNKRMSDLSINLDALFLLFGIVQPIELVFNGWGWIFTGLVAFLAYKIVVWAGFHLLSRRCEAGTPGRTLLLLRVFSLGQRSKRMLDLLSHVWLRCGPINLIAGPDLATATVEPHEFMDFLGGHLSRRFVQGEADLAERLSYLDIQPDPDGRYRVNEFFCHANTWQMTMQALAGQCDAVLMDLRSFTKNNQGCLYELHQLVNSVPLDRLVLVIDNSTDRSFLEAILRELWLHLDAASPNSTLTRPVIHCFPVKKQTPAEIEQLFSFLVPDARS